MIDLELATGLAVAIAALRALSRPGRGGITVSTTTYEQAKGRPFSAGPPQVISVPSGWRRMRGEEVGPAEGAFARRALTTKGTPGHQQIEVMPDGAEVMALTEWHHHEPGGPARPWGWHHGITLLVRAG